MDHAAGFSEAIDGLRELLDAAGRTAEAAGVDPATRTRHNRRRRNLRGQLGLFESLAAEWLREVDALPGPRPVIVHRPFADADIKIDAGG